MIGASRLVTHHALRVKVLSQVLQTRVGAGAWTSYLYGHERLASLATPRAWYLTDALGTVRRTVSDAGAIQGTANYSAWGVPQGGLIAPVGFTGELRCAGAAPGGTCGGDDADRPGLDVATFSARPLIRVGCAGRAWSTAHRPDQQ